MSVVQTRNKKMVFGILLSALIVGVMLTIGQVPLAVSQPVTIPVKAIKGPIPMDGATSKSGAWPCNSTVRPKQRAADTVRAMRVIWRMRQPLDANLAG